MLLSKRFFWIGLLIVEFVIKLGLAIALPLFGDESFYWLESQHLAMAYSDVPLATSWLIALGTTVLGHTPIGVRWPFLFLGSSVPVLVWYWAKHFVSDVDARIAASISLLIPLAATLGLLALPDVPLMVSTLLACIALVRAVEHQRCIDYVGLGLVLALGWLSHYRFVLIYGVGLLFLIFTVRGRLQWRSGLFWMSQAIALLGLAPLIWFNFLHHSSGLKFQILDRHPWSFHADAALDFLIQAALFTPFLFLLMLAAMRQVWGQRTIRNPPYDVLFFVSSIMWLVLFVFGFWADRERVRFHWALPTYLLILPLLPRLLRDWQGHYGGGASFALRLVSRLSLPLAGLATLGFFSLLAINPKHYSAFGFREKPLIDNLHEWKEVTHWAHALAPRYPDSVFIANHFMLAAQIAFAWRGERHVFALDHSLNTKHGRALQLSLMGLGDLSLKKQDWQNGLLFFEETAARERERVPAYLALCQRFDQVRLVDELVLYEGHKRFLAFEVTPNGLSKTKQCQLPSMADLSTPLPEQKIKGAQLEVLGWAIQDFVGVAQVELWIDGQFIEKLSYGSRFDGVIGQWPMSQDPNHPWVGFNTHVNISRLAPGSHTLALHVQGNDVRQRILAQRRFWVIP